LQLRKSQSQEKEYKKKLRKSK